MEYISMILLTVVLLAQIILFVLFFLEKWRDACRRSALIQYIERCVEDADCKDEVEKSTKAILNAYGEEIDKRFEKHKEAIQQFKIEALQAVQGELSKQEQSISEQLSKLSLDYSEAQQAANKVNDFASSLASIFDYDPIRAIQKGRNKEAS